MKSGSYLPITIVPSKTFQNQENLIFLNRSLMEYWGLTPFKHINLFIGTKYFQVEIREMGLEKDVIYCSPELFEQIPLPSKPLRFLSQCTKKNLYLGPIFALLTEVQEEEGEEPSFRSVHSFSEELHYISEMTGGFFYVFPIQNFSVEMVEGYYYEEEKWEKAAFPAPNIIYNRIHSRKLENSSFCKKAFTELQVNHIPLFNERFLSKWEVHEILAQEDYLLPHLPDTAILSEAAFLDFIGKYPVVFLKPIHGSQGRSIFRIQKQGERFMIHSSKQEEDEVEILRLEELFSWIKKLQQHRAFIIQEGLTLITDEKRMLDFRVLCHKNVQGNWRATSTVARASSQNEFVSNLARGGEIIKTLTPLLGHFDKKTALSILAFMKELSVEAANVLCQAATGFIGELGVDIGVDTNGRVYIIEINSKPSKNAEEQKAKIRPSAKAIYEYGTALAFEQIRKRFE